MAQKSVDIVMIIFSCMLQRAWLEGRPHVNVIITAIRRDTTHCRPPYVDYIMGTKCLLVLRRRQTLVSRFV